VEYELVQLKLETMQMVLRQMPVLIMVLTVMLQLVNASQRRNRLVLEQRVQSKDRASFT